MKVLISADMEGASGVACAEDVRPGTPAWQTCRSFLTGDVNAAIAGFLDAGAAEVIVNEAHASMRNLVLADLDPRAAAIVGAHKPLGMMEGIANDVSAVAFIGYHAAAGEPGVLSHTYSASGLVRVRVNGEPASEGRMNALLAAEHGVPVVLVTGDDATCADAADFAPHAERVIVKTAVDRFAAICLPPAVTSAAIRASAQRALANRVEPAARSKSYEYEIEFAATNSAAAATLIPGVARVGPREVSFRFETMRAAIRCFAAVAIVASSASEAEYG